MTSTLTRRYLAALADGGGTVPPELAAVRALIGQGHQVTVLGDHSMEPEVRGTGAEFRAWVRAPNRSDRRPEHDPLRDWEVKNPLQLFERLLERQLVGPAPAYAAELRDAIAKERPDVVLCSQFTLGAMIAAEAADIPFVVLMPNVYLLPATGMPPFGMGLKPAHGPIGRLRDHTVAGFTQRTWDKKGLPRLNALRAELGLSPLAHFFDQVHQAERQLVMTSPAFDFPAALPEGARYVGPILDDPTWAKPWTPPSGDAPLVLVGLSSTFQDQLGCLQRIAEALGALPVQGLITTGPALDPSALFAPANVTVVASAPHNEALHHAAAMVTHGGHGSVIKSLAAGVPMVMMPHGRDQADNAARVTSRGAGIAIKRTSSSSRIAAAVERLLKEPTYRENACRLGAAVSTDAASGALLSELEGVRAQCDARTF